MLAALLGLYASTSFTMADPSLVGGYYQIGSYEDLVWFEQRVNSSTTTDQTNSKINAELTEDIIAPEGETWNSPIGKQSNKGGFQGTFNGKGHKIENLQFEPTASGDAGLFGVLKRPHSKFECNQFNHGKRKQLHRTWWWYCSYR